MKNIESWKKKERRKRKRNKEGTKKQVIFKKHNSRDMCVRVTTKLTHTHIYIYITHIKKIQTQDQRIP